MISTASIPPAGHAAALLSDALYIVGGGNNSAGCADLMCLDLGGLATGQPLAWSSVAKAEPRSAIASEGVPGSLHLASPIGTPACHLHASAEGRGPPCACMPMMSASDCLARTVLVLRIPSVPPGDSVLPCTVEAHLLHIKASGATWELTFSAVPEICVSPVGLSLVAVRSAGALVAFGGYNGKYHNSAQVFRPGKYCEAYCSLSPMHGRRCLYCPCRQCMTSSIGPSS